VRRALAVDVGGTKTAVGVVDAAGRILGKETRPTPLGDPAEAVALIVSMATDLLRGHGPVDAAGAALPGVVDRASGILRSSPSSGWRDIPFGPMLSAALGLPFAVDNDVRACAWAESTLGGGAGLGSFFWMTVSTGVGGALFQGGRVIEGARGLAGELGHLVVEPGGAACGCGRRGCLEAEAAGPAWRRMALAELADGRAGAYLAGLADAELDARRIAAGARSGDEACLRIAERAGLMLARGLEAVYAVLDPEAVFIGGGVGGALDLLGPVIERELSTRVFLASERDILPRPSALGYDAALEGAAALALFPR
jgi:glucokinase